MEDELGICADLEREMEGLVGTYFDEWKAVVDDPERQKQFRQFVNTVSPHPYSAFCIATLIPYVKDERVGQMEKVTERGQARPADWAKAAPPLVLRETDINTPKSQWKWRKLATVRDLVPNDGGTT